MTIIQIVTLNVLTGSDDEGPVNGVSTSHNNSTATQATSNSEDSKRKDASSISSSGNVTCYRFGSVGQDTLICLWDITEDILKQSTAAHLKAVRFQIFYVLQWRFDFIYRISRIWITVHNNYSGHPNTGLVPILNGENANGSVFECHLNT